MISFVNEWKNTFSFICAAFVAYKKQQYYPAKIIIFCVVTSIIADAARAVTVVVAVAAVSVPCLTVPIYHLIRAAHIL